MWDSNGTLAWSDTQNTCLFHGKMKSLKLLCFHAPICIHPASSAAAAQNRDQSSQPDVKAQSEKHRFMWNLFTVSLLTMRWRSLTQWDFKVHWVHLKLTWLAAWNGFHVNISSSRSMLKVTAGPVLLFCDKSNMALTTVPASNRQ